MKKRIIIFLIAGLTACNQNTKSKKTITPNKKQNTSKIDINNILETGVLYEANIRQYSPEGDFNSFTKDIPELKKLGVKIIWLMPIHPISVEKRKAKGDLLVSEIKDKKEQKKYLGSPYAVANYKKINPDLGTKEDLNKLIKTAHKNGILVILDWVANHTGWDHHWIKEHPEFYTKNNNGEITDPLNDDGSSIGWTDVADLDYSNNELHINMINEMKYWITNHNIDGFRCDVAGSVPLDFWKKAIPELRKQKNIIMLAEAWEPELLTNNLFDMAYAWEGHHIMNEIAQQKKTVSDWDNYIKKIDTLYQKDDILLNFITNHDENSWNGTVKERLGNASEALLALTYITPGMPLIYSGQEYNLNHRLKFFEKDSIPKTKGKIWEVLSKLGHLKNNSPALNGGKKAAKYERLHTNNDNKILAIKRTENNSEIIYIANLSPENVTFSLTIPQNFKTILSNHKSELNKTVKNFKPWEYKVLTINK